MIGCLSFSYCEDEVSTFERSFLIDDIHDEHRNSMIKVQKVFFWKTKNFLPLRYTFSNRESLSNFSDAFVVEKIVQS